MKHLILFCDGGSRGNPGPAASGFVIYHLESAVNNPQEIADKAPIVRTGKFLGSTTNNQAEWQAVVLGLEYIQNQYGSTCSVQVFLDSELVVKQIKGQYKVKNPDLKPWFLQAQALIQSFTSVTIQHVYREFNKEADSVVNEILDATRV